jgi:hypothetical protein
MKDRRLSSNIIQAISHDDVEDITQMLSRLVNKARIAEGEI